MWSVTDPAAIAAVAGVMGPKPVYIADGHHRYETACNYRDELKAACRVRSTRTIRQISS